jgi:hypothetical protein
LDYHGRPEQTRGVCGHAAVASRIFPAPGGAPMGYGMTDLPFKRAAIRVLVSVLAAAAVLAVLVPRQLENPEGALKKAVAGALAQETDNRLLETALQQYPESAPAIAITYGHLDLFREQLARFGPQVVPIVAAYQNSLTTADALQMAGQAVQSVRNQLSGDRRVVDLAPLTPEERGLVALLKMRDEGNAFVGQWEITDAGEARRIPSRVVTLGGPELLIGGLTALERDLVQKREIDWETYGLAAVDVAAIGAGVALLRFARTAARAAPAATRTATLRSGALAAAEVLAVGAIRYGVPIGLFALMILHPVVFTHYLWLLAESLGVPGMLGPIIGWGIVVVPLAFLFSWMLLSVRLLRFFGWLFAGAARACRHLATRLAPAER